MKQIKKVKTTPSSQPSFGVIDSLNSESITDSLSANQGRMLNKMLENAKFKTLWENWDSPVASGGSTDVVENLSSYDILLCVCGPAKTETSVVSFIKGCTNSQFNQYVFSGYRASYRVSLTTDNRISMGAYELIGWGSFYLFKVVGVKYE